MSITRDIDFVPGFDLFHNIHLQDAGNLTDVTGSVFTFKVYRRQGSPLLATAAVNTFFQATGHIGFGINAAVTADFPPDCYYEIGMDSIALLVGRLCYRGVNGPFNTDTTIDTGNDTVIDLGYAIELQDPGVSSPSMQAGEARNLRVASADWLSAPVKALFIGDSITEGWSASGRSTRYMGVARDKVANNLGGYIPGDGYVPCFIVGGGFFYGYGLPGWTTNAGTPTVNTTYGLGLRATNLPVGARIQIVNQCSRFSLFYPQYPSAGSIGVYLDGTLLTTLNPANATTLGSRRYDSPDLGLIGTHTIELRQSGGSAAIVEGAYFFGSDFDRGWQFWDAAHFGYRCDHFMASRSFDGFDTIAPDVIVINMLTNDMFAFSPDVCEANLRTMALLALSKCVGLAPSLKFVIPWGTDAVADQAAFLPYRQAIMNVAQELGGSLFDWNAIVQANPDTYGITFGGDMTHPIEVGHYLLGTHLGQDLVDTVGGGSGPNVGTITKATRKLYVGNSSGETSPPLLSSSPLGAMQCFIGQGSGSTAPTGTGCAWTVNGTASHPTPTDATGPITNLVSGGGANGIAGVNTTDVRFLRGATYSLGGGFFFHARARFPDASYTESGASTGARIRLGLTDQAPLASLASDNPAGHRVTFERVSNNGGRIQTTWNLSIKDGTTESLLDLTLPFVQNDLYEFWIWCEAGDSTIGYEIEDLTTGARRNGTRTANLPGASTAMRATAAVLSINAVARNWQHGRVACEIPQR